MCSKWSPNIFLPSSASCNPFISIHPFTKKVCIVGMTFSSHSSMSLTAKLQSNSRAMARWMQVGPPTSILRPLYLGFYLETQSLINTLPIHRQWLSFSPRCSMVSMGSLHPQKALGHRLCRLLRRTTSMSVNLHMLFCTLLNMHGNAGLWVPQKNSGSPMASPTVQSASVSGK